MPYRSKAQQRYFHAVHPPGVNVSEWDRATKKRKGGFAKLPEHVGKIAAQPNDFRPRRKRTITIAQRPDEVHGQPDTYHGPEMIGDYAEASRRRFSRTARLAGSYRETKRYIANTPGAERRRYQLTSTYRPLHTRKRVYVAGALAAGAAGGAALAAHRIRKDAMTYTDAFGVARPDLSVDKADRVRMNRSEKREMKTGLGLAAGGAGSFAGGGYLTNRAVDLHNRSMAQGAEAFHQAKRVMGRRGTGIPRGGEWHAPGSVEHAKLGDMMHAIGSAQKATKGLQRAQRMERVGTGGLLAGGAALTTGSTLAQHAVARHQRRAVKVRQQQRARRFAATGKLLPSPPKPPS